MVGSTKQRLDKPRPATLIGKGKAYQVRDEARRLGATTVFFDCELSPSQAKNLDKIMNKKSTNYFTSRAAEAAGQAPPQWEDYGGEELFGSLDSHDGHALWDLDEAEEEVGEEEEDCIELEKVTVGDRTALILDIFSQRAATREGKLQVEMAQAQYQLPRLTRMWTHLERQSGGGGGSSAQNRGMGETQIEVDKRLLRKRISLIKRELESVRAQRKQFRRKRSRANVPVVALVGYTNAGKSSLLNQLSVRCETAGNVSDRKLVKARDQLFATLDPTTRKVRLPSGKKFLVTDTVGFVQQLPSTLIAAFRATLEEIGSADLLIHVVDVSSPYAYAHVDAVESTLREIPGASDVPVIHAWNKIDRMGEEVAGQVRAATNRSNTVCISAASGEGIGELLEAIESAVVSSGDMKQITAVLPYDRGDLLDLLHSQGVMIKTEYLEEGTRVEAMVPRPHVHLFEAFSL